MCLPLGSPTSQLEIPARRLRNQIRRAISTGLAWHSTTGKLKSWSGGLIEISPRARADVCSKNGELVCIIATEDSYFILKFDEASLASSRDTKEGLSEDGYEDAFDVSLSKFS